MNRLLLVVMVLLCATVSGFAKRKIHLNSQARFPKPPIEVFIDDQILEFDISKDFGVLNILIEDVSGNVVYRSTIDGNKGMVPLNLDLKEGEYVLVITSEEQALWGNLSVEL